jgi:transposase
MPRTAASVVLLDGARAEIERWVRAQSTPQQVALRSRIVLMAADGKLDLEIASELGVSRHTVALWRNRFREEGLDGVWEIAPGRGRKPRYSEDKVAAIVEATLQSKPKGAPHWSCRTMADQHEVSKNTINRIWPEHNLTPQRSRTCKLSRDPQFLEKLTDVVGLYLNQPDKSLVVCVDEKSQIQALDRTQPGLPIKKGRCGTRTHDYKRNGTTTLFAALEILEGKVIGECYGRQRHQEFIKFLRRLDEEFPAELNLHLVVDNYGTHKHPKVQSWLERHPRCKLHFIPTSSSWLNQVERWFGELTAKAVRRGSCASVAELQRAIEEFLESWNENPRPFVWTASVEKIMEKVSRARTTLDGIKPGWARRTRRKKAKQTYS